MRARKIRERVMSFLLMALVVVAMMPMTAGAVFAEEDTVTITYDVNGGTPQSNGLLCPDMPSLPRHVGPGPT